jgi:ribonuclease HII
MIVCGLDECGRGSLAGPLVAAGVILKKSIKGLKDSKKLSISLRNRLYKKILINAEVVIESISVRQINNRGIGWANKEVFKKIIKRLQADKYVVDGNLKIRVNKKTKKILSLIKADTKVAEVMAASIVAKVTRDGLMKEWHQKYPMYGWQTNVGYGTAYHIRAIRECGMVYHHRRMFVTTALRKVVKV